MRVILAAQAPFGVAVLRALRDLPGVEVAWVIAPAGDLVARIASGAGIPVTDAPGDAPEADLLVVAHTHADVAPALARVHLGGIALSIGHGKDPFRDRVPGADVACGVHEFAEGGAVGRWLALEWHPVSAGESALGLWRRLQSVGVRLLAAAVASVAEDAMVVA